MAIKAAIYTFFIRVIRSHSNLALLLTLCFIRFVLPAIFCKPNVNKTITDVKNTALVAQVNGGGEIIIPTPITAQKVEHYSVCYRDCSQKEQELEYAISDYSHLPVSIKFHTRSLSNYYEFGEGGKLDTACKKLNFQDLLWVENRVYYLQDLLLLYGSNSSPTFPLLNLLGEVFFVEVNSNKKYVMMNFWHYYTNSFLSYFSPVLIEIDESRSTTQCRVIPLPVGISIDKQNFIFMKNGSITYTIYDYQMWDRRGVPKIKAKYRYNGNDFVLVKD